MFLDEAVRASLRDSRRRMDEMPARVLEGLVERMPEPADFAAAVGRRGAAGIIAEVKRMSPSAGAIREDADVAGLVSAYERGGACAVSVLTCGYRFGGRVEDLAEARAATGLPLLRKDFITDEYQILEARAFGASAVLLIAAALEKARLERLMSYAAGLRLCPLVEVHCESDLEKAVEAGAEAIGINNRDLGTLEVDLSTTERLLPMVPGGRIVVSESGIASRVQVRRMEEAGVDAVLVGEALMRSKDPESKLRELLGEVSERCG